MGCKNNKVLGTEFEMEFCELLASKGYWVHFINPDRRGAQPFDIIAVKDGVGYAFDCKTSARHIFPISRLEDNQIYAFEKWLKCGNNMPQIAVKYKDRIHLIDYADIRAIGKVDLDGDECRTTIIL